MRRVMDMSRAATLERNTSETSIRLKLEVDGSGSSRIETGIGFFDHMLTLFSRHGLFDLELVPKGLARFQRSCQTILNALSVHVIGNQI